MLTKIIDTKYSKKIPISLDDIHNLKCIYLYGDIRLLYNIENNIYLISHRGVSKYYKDEITNINQIIDRAYFIVDVDTILKLTSGEEIIISNKCSFIMKKKHFYKIYARKHIQIFYNQISQKNYILDLIRKLKFDYIKHLQ